MEQSSNNQFPQLIKFLDKGAFGEVHKGIWNNKLVAVKILNIDNKKVTLEQIAREIKVLKELKHPNIIEYLGDYQQDDNIHLIMEFAENGTLKSFIEINKVLVHDWEFNKNLMLQITKGLIYLHEEKILHRDLKSGNILLDKDNNIKICDFGVSKIADELSLLQDNTNNNPFGSVRWMAPENIGRFEKNEELGKNICKSKYSKYSDVYSLGMVFWEISSKKTLPFKNLNDQAVIYNVAFENLREDIASDTPKKIEKIIISCWSIIPNKRIKLDDTKEKLTRFLTEEESDSEEEKKESLLEISPADNKTRNILIVGLTGSGKSALANTLSRTEDFKSGSQSISLTKNFQHSEIFEWENNGIIYKFSVVDNIGFGDTEGKDFLKVILYRIGEGIVKIQERGINQILFLFKDRFSPTVIKAFETFKDFINESQVTEFTTLIRTNFINFDDDERCENDKKTLLEENSKIKDIIESCNSIIHIDNSPLIEIKKTYKKSKDKERDERRNKTSKENQQESRERVLNHLIENCSNNYKLNWDKNIEDKVIDCLWRLEKLQESNIPFNLLESEATKQVKKENFYQEMKESFKEGINAGIEEIEKENDYQNIIEDIRNLKI